MAAIQAAADGTVEGIGAIGQTIAKMSDAASTVAAAAEQQGQASQEIAQAIANAAVEARTISGSIGSVREAAASNETQAGTVWDGANHVAASANTMQAAIETFLHRVHAA